MCVSIYLYIYIYVYVAVGTYMKSDARCVAECAEARMKITQALRITSGSNSPAYHVVLKPAVIGHGNMQCSKWMAQTLSPAPCIWNFQ